MKSLYLILVLLFSSSSFANSSRSEFIEQTRGTISFDQRIVIPIVAVYKKIEALDIEGFEYGYACQDIGKAQLAIDLALHRKMEVKHVPQVTRLSKDEDYKAIVEKIDLNKLSDDLDRIQDQICRRDI